MRAMEKGLSGFVRLNGHQVQLGAYERGGPQGNISMPHRWKWLIAQFLRECLLVGISVEVDGFLLPGFGYVDDLTLPCHDGERRRAIFEHRSRFADRWGISWSLPKDHLLLRGRGAARRGCFPGDSMESEPTIEVLGEILGPDPLRCPQQVGKALKGFRAAAAGIDWLVWKGAAAGLEVAGPLFESVAQSVPVAHLVFTSVTDAEWRDFESVKATTGRRLLRVHQRASVCDVYAELGWLSVRAAVTRARLGFVGRLFRGEGSEAVQAVLQSRLQQVQEWEDGGCEGDAGFLGRERASFLFLGLGRFWGARPFPTKAAWRDICRDAVLDAHVREWRSNKISPLKEEWDAELYPLRLTGATLALVAAFRLGVTFAGADKLSPEQLPCRFCKTGQIETGIHLVAECKAFEEDRAAMLRGLGFYGTRPSSSTVWSLAVCGSEPQVKFLEAISTSFEAVAGSPLVPVFGRRAEYGDVAMMLRNLEAVAKWMSKTKHDQ